MEIRLGKLNDFDTVRNMYEVIQNDWIYGRYDPYRPKSVITPPEKPLFCDEDLKRFAEEVDITPVKFERYVTDKKVYIVEKDDTIVSAFIINDKHKGYYRILYWLITELDLDLTLRKESLKKLANKIPWHCNGFFLCSPSHKTELTQLGFREEIFSFYYADIDKLAS